MYCSKCGTQLDAEAKFCGFCGYGFDLFEKNRGNVQKEVLSYIKGAIKSPTSVLKNSEYVSNVHAMIMLLIGVIVINISSIIEMKGYLDQTKRAAIKMSNSLGALGDLIRVEDIYGSIISSIFPSKELFSIFIKGSIFSLILLMSLSAIIYGIFVFILKKNVKFTNILSVVAITTVLVSILTFIKALITFVSIKLNLIMAISIGFIYIILIYEGLKSSTNMKKGICGAITVGAQLLNAAVLYILIKLMM